MEFQESPVAFMRCASALRGPPNASRKLELQVVTHDQLHLVDDLRRDLSDFQDRVGKRHTL